MIQDLMIKGKDEFLEHFARLGVFSKVAALAGPQETTPEPETESNQSGDDQRMEDAKELLIGRAYHWRDWCICRGRDCLYIWSDAAALELSNGSNGWFRFILDGKLATMYSSGSPEGGTDTSGKHICMLDCTIAHIYYSFYYYCLLPKCCFYLFTFLICFHFILYFSFVINFCEGNYVKNNCGFTNCLQEKEGTQSRLLLKVGYIYV